MACPKHKTPLLAVCVYNTCQFIMSKLSEQLSLSDASPDGGSPREASYQTCICLHVLAAPGLLNTALRAYSFYCWIYFVVRCIASTDVSVCAHLVYLPIYQYLLSYPVYRAHINLSRPPVPFRVFSGRITCGNPSVRGPLPAHRAKTLLSGSV